MTLAQRYGLVKQPPKLLSGVQWRAVHAQSQAREDSTGECCICREHFGPGEQVLLSCSHSFHRDCLASFERWGLGTLACKLCAQLLTSCATAFGPADCIGTSGPHDEMAAFVPALCAPSDHGAMCTGPCLPVACPPALWLLSCAPDAVRRAERLPPCSQGLQCLTSYSIQTQLKAIAGTLGSAAAPCAGQRPTRSGGSLTGARCTAIAAQFAYRRCVRQPAWGPHQSAPWRCFHQPGWRGLAFPARRGVVALPEAAMLQYHLKIVSGDLRIDSTSLQAARHNAHPALIPEN